MQDQEETFRRLILPHFDVGYNLALWLTKNEANAGDVFQDACLKALRFLHSLRTDNPRAWFLQIVRTTAFTQLKRQDPHADEELDDIPDPAPGPEEALSLDQDANVLKHALEEIPPLYREILILRELEEESYESIAAILQVPEGTVMSRLSRARQLLKQKMQAKRRAL